MVKKKKSNPLSLVIILLTFFMLAMWFYKPVDTTTLKTSEIVDLFKEQKVEEYKLDFASGNLSVTVKDEEEPIIVKIPSAIIFIDQIEPYVEEYNANNKDSMKYDWTYTTNMGQTIMNVLYAVMLFGMFGAAFFVFNQTRGGGKGMSVGMAKTKDLTDVTKIKTFKDVAGADEEKEELVEIVDFLKNTSKYSQLGARIPKGVLLAGPPGTGKTLLARAVAGEAGAPFFSMSGSEFTEMYVGVGASRVRDLFAKAKKNAPSIIFIDEIDAVGRQRGTGLGGGHDEREQTLNQLLVEMDGFGATEGVIVIAATNRVDVLDSALLRPGRFDRQIYVGYPDIKGREEILKVHFNGKPMGPDVKLGDIAKGTPGFTGADLENLVNEGALLAAKRGRKAITQNDLEDSVIKVAVGPEKKSKVVSDEDKKLTSYHEAGHALATYFSKTQDPVQEISIIPRGMAGGYTLSLPQNDTNYTTKTKMFENIVTLLGGRCAEQLILDDISTGASNDLERVTSTAKAMVTRYGFSEKLGNVVYGHDQSQTFLGRDYSQGQSHSEQIASEIDAEVRSIVDKGYKQCMTILEDHVDKLHLVAAELMKFEKISGERFKELIAEDYVEPAVEEVVNETIEPIVTEVIEPTVDETVIETEE